MAVVELNIVIAINHESTSFGAESLMVPHASMSGDVVLEANDDPFTQLSVEYGRTTRTLSVAELVHSSFESAALAAAPCASLVELAEYVLAIAHEACGFLDRLTSVGLLPKLALVCSDASNACLS